MINHFKELSYLVIEVNSSCNLKCLSCNREELVASGKREPKEITPEELEQLLSKFKDCRIDTIKLEGISEPMLHRRFDECARVVKKVFPSAFVIIATNLQYQIERTTFKETLRYVDMVYLSIDGVGKIYEDLRPPAKYKRLLSSLEYIKDVIPSEDKKKLFVNFVLGENNLQCLDDIYELVDNYELAGVRINLAQNWSEDQKNSLSLKLDDISSLKKYAKDVKGVAGWKYENCFWPYEGLVIDVYGDVRQCIINTTQEALCNIYKDDVEEYFNSSLHYKKTRELLCKNIAADNCKNCDYFYLAGILESIIPQELRIPSREFKK
ncbi:radical SAM/SPASM domain-containing protein [Bacteriovorax sp. Seq25_V]|uniref:radical SAM/SPASM domain-containing protein n=1 Tax=Bacteriovorax sp. Seq25_V TaxID=1201288 RepID=UPI00038A5275|nr:radical SAM protein [Bacteriovorax sp. Seq25_V]EQC45707.1 radical SAM domain protein [Bacteriovorax sp. Seq25_V]